MSEIEIAVMTEFRDLMRDSAARLGVMIETNLEEVQVYASERVLHLSTIVGERGFDEAVTAEAMNVTMKASNNTVNLADAADREFFGAIAGGLRIVARVISGGVVG